MMSFQVFTKRKEERKKKGKNERKRKKGTKQRRITLLSQCSQTPESHYDNEVFLHLHLKFHLKNPLCFLPFKVEVKTESGQCPST